MISMRELRIQRIERYVDQWNALWASVDDGQYALMSPEEVRRFNAALHVIETNALNELSALRRTI